MAACRSAESNAVQALDAEADRRALFFPSVIVPGHVLSAFLDEEWHQEESCNRVGPPPGKQTVESQAHKHCEVLEIAE